MDVSVILNAHHEGILAHPSCVSLAFAKAAAERAGLAVEVLVVLDRADAETNDYFSSRRPVDWHRIETDFGDPGCARNEGVRLARGQWIAFLDADDLFSENWLVAAHASARNDDRLVVWHPELNIYFGQNRRIFKHVDMDDKAIDPARLICSNFWTALCFAPRTLLLRAPYPETLLARQLGFEDWAWNIAVLEEGAIHKIVPNTGHLIRIKTNSSVVRATTGAGCIPPPSRYFRQVLRSRNFAGASDYPK